MKGEHSLEALCGAFGVSRSGYYDWLKSRQHPGKRASEDAQISQDIARIHASSRGTYGSPRIAACLRSEGRRHGRSRIARLMRHDGLYGRQKGRYRVQTTDSNHEPPHRPQSPRVFCCGGARRPKRAVFDWARHEALFRAWLGWDEDLATAIHRCQVAARRAGAQHS